MNGLRRLVATCVAMVLVSGCSVTTLRCGTDGDSSFVDLTSAPQDISANSRYYGELCAFAYEGDDDEG